MSTIVYTEDAALAADIELYDEDALIYFQANPEALLDLIYGATRRPYGFTPAHDHAEDGGETLYTPILSHSFGSFYDNNSAALGFPLPVCSTVESVVSFASTASNGITDRTYGKRLFCAGVLIPGGVSSVRVSVVEWHAQSGLSTQLTATLRGFPAVNIQLGVATDEVLGDISYTTSGSGTWSVQSVTLSDLAELGDPTQDRECEFALWITSDIDQSYDQRLYAVYVVPIAVTSFMRAQSPQDLIHPTFAARELKADLGVFSAQLSAKIREGYNGLNRGLWGYTPGLLPDLTPDRRRRYREDVSGPHTHEGLIVPDGSGGVYSAGALMRDAQSIGLCVSGNISFRGAGLPPYARRAPNGGERINSSPLSNLWTPFTFRRSIPAGCGALVMRVAYMPPAASISATDQTSGLYLSASVALSSGGSSIVSRVFCGPFVSPINSADPDYGLCELRPVDDLAYLTNASLESKGWKGWCYSAEIDDATKDSLKIHRALLAARDPVLYRISMPILVVLTYPPQRPQETAHETADYDVTIKLFQRDSADYITGGRLQWILCYNSTGY